MKFTTFVLTIQPNDMKNACLLFGLLLSISDICGQDFEQLFVNRRWSTPIGIPQEINHSASRLDNQIRSSVPLNSAEVNIRNALGEMVIQTVFNGTGLQIKVSTLPSGLYLISIKLASSLETHKIMVE
jgi:hypothetical protein